MTSTARRIALAVALAATLWLAIRAHDDEPEPAAAAVVEAVTPVRRTAVNVAPRERRQNVAAASWDPFNPAVAKPKVEPRKVAPPPPSPSPAPPPPSAPPLPFTYFGLVTDASGGSNVFIAQGSTLLPVTAGLVIDGQYRVDKVGASEIVFTYLPLGTTQVLSQRSVPP